MANNDKFYYIEGNCSVKNFLKTFATEVTKNAGIYKWDLAYPKNLDEIGGSTKEEEIDLITDSSTTDEVETKVKKSGAEDKIILATTTSFGKKFYLKMERTKDDLSTEEKKSLVDFDSLHTYYYGNNSVGHRTDAEVLALMNSKGSYDTYVSAKTKSNAINHVRVQFGDKLNKAKNDLDISKSILDKYYYRLSWYKRLPPEIKEWLPLEFTINVTKDSINLIIIGDPSADETKYLTSYMYVGSLKPVEDSAFTDDIYNFGVTTSSDVEPTYNHSYGVNTGTGITDMCMLANKIGMPYQPHYPKYQTDHIFADKCNIAGSRWNHGKREFSEITLTHKVDRERGKMENVLIGDSGSLNDGDYLEYKKGEEDEAHYKKFKITAPFSFINNSANNNYCLAIRCYKEAK